jgi:SEC-C motif
MREVGRNARCPCGSGLKYKRCCLRRGDDAALDALEVERVWERMQSWALERFGDELSESLKEHMDARGVGGERRPALDGDLSLALCWLLIDREVAAGDTPAKLYSQLPELSAPERGMAGRIVASRLGLYRVTDVQPGVWIELESVIGGSSTRVASPQVSREAVLWQVLVCRVMEGGPTPSLWGAAQFYEPSEEDELLAELRRIAEEHDLGVDAAGMATALCSGAGELLCFIPPSRRAERLPYTLEGDPVVMAQASWQVRTPDLVFRALRTARELTFDGATEHEQAVTFDWLTSRRGLLARRSPLPAGAICMEGGPVTIDQTGELGLDDVTSLGTFTLYADRLEFFAMSQARLDAAVALIERLLQNIAGSPVQNVRSVEDAVGERRGKRARSRERSPSAREPRAGDGSAALRPPEDPGGPDPRMQKLVYRRWIDDPNPQLGGLSPRTAAARCEYRRELEGQLRSIEYGSARERPDRCPGPEVAWLRLELGLEHDRLVA